MTDYRFHCEDCDSYSQCQYYHNRKGTSLICKEFQYGSSVIEQIRDEIEKPLLVERYADTESAKAQAIALSWCLEIIDKYTKEQTE